ncbi:MAG: helix-turn-helix domain-containing protein [Tabrizicola sp.]|nr:helix-turn-helix domain-containing protein [Tabrizicola sp.]
MVETLYSVDEALAILKIGRTSLYKEAGLGKIKLKKIGGKTVIPASALNAYVENLPDFVPAGTYR